LPEVTDDEVGRRIFQLNKERHVEQSIEKIRRSLGESWMKFSPEDVEFLKYIFGETWVAMERREWAATSFTRLTKDEVKEIIEIGRKVKKKDMLESAGVKEVSRVLGRYT
jgi:hypothetical protein